VAGLFAAESGSGFEHLFEDVFIADIGAEHLDAAGGESFFKAHVAHGGGDDGVVGEGGASFHGAGGDEEDGVSVDDVAEGVTEESAVGVSVEGDAEIEVAGTALDFSGDVFGVESAAGIVDVASVGRDVKGFGGDADAGEELGSDGGGGSVGAVDEDAKVGEAGGVHAGGEPGFVVGTQGGIAGKNVGHQAAGGGLVGGELVNVLEDLGLDPMLDLVGELHAVAAEELDAVVLPGIVRGGNDDAGGESVGAGEVGDAGSGEDTGAGEGASGIAQAKGESFGDPSAGLAGVLPENDFGRAEAADEAGTAGASDGVDGGAVEGIFTGDGADAVGSKELTVACLRGRCQVRGLQLSKMISA